jgi:Zn-dependent peptidase ImmA (M78 family)/DNA-binding XRE family transcriptional regulator
MSKTFRPSRLELARKRRGLTKAALSERSGVSARSLSAYENERTTPKDETVSDLAQALGFPPRFFYKAEAPIPTVENVSFRALSQMSAAERDAGLGAIGLAIDLDRWIDRRFERPNPSVPSLREQEPEGAAEALRAEWKLGQRPIPNMIHLLEAHGIRVYSLAPLEGQLDAVSMWWEGTPYVFLNTTTTAERSRFDAAHELGHLVLHRHGGPSGQVAEREANSFAGSLLMPRSDVHAHGKRRPTFSQIVTLKRRWRVSAMALVYRLHELDIISDWHYRKLCIRLRSEFGQSEPNGIQPESSQALAKVFAFLRDEGISQRGVARQLALPPDDLRELVFSLVLTPLEGGQAEKDGSDEFDTDRPILGLM